MPVKPVVSSFKSVNIFLSSVRVVFPRSLAKRSGTSIGANAEESVGGRSRADFINKIYISYKEARETHYWLRLLKDTKFIPEEKAESLLNKCDELIRITGSIIATTEATMKC
jgi:four helix bundle protein